jgi:tetrahydromethanopterin S-methyltransferase subunit C
VRDVLGHGVLRSDGAGVDTVGLAGLGEGVVAAVEVLALLEVLGELVAAGWELAVEAEEALLFGRKGLNISRDVSAHRSSDGTG